MIEINLIPDVKQEFLRAQRMRTAAVSFSIMAGLIAGGIVVVLGLLVGAQIVHEKVSTAALNREYKNLTSINGVSDLLTIQSQLSSVSDLSDGRSMTSRMFDTLVAISPSAPNEIKISKVMIAPETTEMTIEGSTAAGFTATDVFRKTILNTKVYYQISGQEGQEVPLTDDVVMGTTSYGEDGSGQRVLRFTLTFKYPAELLTNTGKNVRVESPSGQIDVTDSKTRVPDSLFSEQAKDIEEGDN